MLPLAVMCVLVLFAVLAFAVDQGIAYAAKARQENALDAARSACMDASFALAAKNDENPGRLIANLVTRTVREEGFAGRVRVWFFEAPADVLPATERLWAIGMQLEEDVSTVFARGYGIDSLPAASHRVVLATPYASECVWRPDMRACGRYEVSAGADLATSRYTELADLDAFPDEMVAEVRGALPEGSGL